MRSTWIRPLVPLLLLGACTTWRSRELSPPAEPPALSGRSSVRVTSADGRVQVLERARIEGDSLVGAVGRPRQRATVALRDVSRLEEQRVSGPRTFGLVAGLTVVAAVVFSAMATAAFLGDIQ